MPKISIIVPVFNSMPYLPTCLHSLINQTEESIEIFLINDHSTDKSFEILKYYESLYPKKIKVLNLKEKHGASAARNMGLQMAQGECVGFVDADDVVSLNMFGDFYKYLKEEEASIVMGHNRRITNNEYCHLETFKTIRENPTILEDDNHFICSCWDKLFLHDFIEKETFLENHIYEDVSFTFPFLLKAKTIVEVKEKDYLYRKNEEGISCSSEKMNLKIFDIFDVVKDAIERGKKYRLSKSKMDILKNYLKKAVLCRIQYIASWNITEKEKCFLLEKMLSALNFYLPKIKEIQAKENDPAKNALLNLRNYSYEELEKETDAILTFKRAKRYGNSLIRKN